MKTTKHSTIYDKEGKVVFHIYELRDGTFTIQTNKQYKMSIDKTNKQVHINKLRKDKK